MSTTTVRTVTPSVHAGVAGEVWRYFADPSARGAGAGSLFSRLPVESPVTVLGRFVVVATHDLVRDLSRSPSLRMPNPSFPDAVVRGNPGFVAAFRDTLSFQGPQEHARLRGVLAAVFAPAAVREHREVVDEVVADLLGAAGAGAGHPFSLEFVRDVAEPLPVRVTGALLGLPADDGGWLEARTHGLLAQLQRSFPGTGHHHGEPVSPREFDEVVTVARDLLRTPRTRLTAALARAVASGAVSPDEAARLVLLLLMTGIDTVTSALTNTVHQVVDLPALGGLQDATTTPADVFAEAVRLHTPSAFAPREVLEPVEVAGHRLGRGDAVMLCLAAANRDPRRFADPAAWKPGRRPAGHSGFGHGAHHCLGAGLAGVQAEALLVALARHHVRRDPGLDLTWRQEVAFHGPASLPLVLDPRVLDPQCDGSRP